MTPRSTTTKDELEAVAKGHGLQFDCDQFIVWDKSSPDHPRNWMSGIKCYNAGFVLLMEMVMAALTSVGAAVSVRAHKEYGISEILGCASFTTTTLIGFGVGVIFVPPMSETYGRKALYAWASFAFSVFCTLIPSVPVSAPGSLASVVVGCFMIGLSGTTPNTVGLGSLEDMYNSEHRIWAVFAFTTVSNAGVVLGPIFSNYITTSVGWRWVYWIGSVVGGLFFIFSFTLKESRPSILLERKLAILRDETGNETLQIRHHDQALTIQSFLQETLLRPLHLLCTEPIIMLCSAIHSTAFALIYGLTEALPIVYVDLGFSRSSSSLSFLPILIGLFPAAFCRIADYRLFKRLEKRGITPTPEAKLNTFSIAVSALAIALWIFAWTIPPLIKGVPWIVPMLALVLVGYATNDLNTILSGYVADSYTTYAASASSAMSLLLSVLSSTFPLFMTPMFESLGSNIAMSILAAIATVFCVSPPILLRYGCFLREKSHFACYSKQLTMESIATERNDVESRPLGESMQAFQQ